MVYHNLCVIVNLRPVHPLCLRVSLKAGILGKSCIINTQIKSNVFTLSQKCSCQFKCVQSIPDLEYCTMQTVATKIEADSHSVAPLKSNPVVLRRVST